MSVRETDVPKTKKSGQKKKGGPVQKRKINSGEKRLILTGEDGYPLERNGQKGILETTQKEGPKGKRSLWGSGKGR